MSDLYYQPEVKELHIGLECLFKGEKVTISIGHLTWILMDYKERVKECKIKYLDSQDIEELGWTKIPTPKETHKIEDSLVFRLEQNEITLYTLKSVISNRLKGNINVSIRVGYYWHSYFMGNIKNKSELRKLMQQLNII